VPLTLIAPPAEEPLTLAEAKAFARIETTEDDVLVQALILSARLHVEAMTRRFLVTQSWRFELARMPAAGRIVIPAAPAQSIMAARFRDRAGAATALDPSAWQADLSAIPPAVELAAALPSGMRLEFDLVLGYGAAAAVPEPLRHALKLLVASWYEERGTLAMTGEGAELPGAVLALLAPFRMRGL
jgi:uncharacterized phiE125 gp8 family phage protein